MITHKQKPPSICTFFNILVYFFLAVFMSIYLVADIVMHMQFALMNFSINVVLQTFLQ